MTDDPRKFNGAGNTSMITPQPATPRADDRPTPAQLFDTLFER
jgi:hypothetical protein